MSAGTGALSSHRRNFRVVWRCLSQSLSVSPGSSGWLDGAGGNQLGPAGLHPAPLAPVQLLAGVSPGMASLRHCALGASSSHRCACSLRGGRWFFWGHLLWLNLPNT